MATTRVVRSRVIEAPAAVAWDLIADYRHGHPRILPPKYFGTLELLQGGRGAGTVIRFEMTLLGRTTVATAEVTEPVPGRELVETITDGPVTTFLVEPLDADRCRVTIATVVAGPGWRGWLEGWLAGRLLPRVYEAELAQLDHVAGEERSGGGRR